MGRRWAHTPARSMRSPGCDSREDGDAPPITSRMVAMTDLVEIGRFGALVDAEQRALVLAAVGIEAHLIADAGVVRLCVTSSEALRARHELGCYERENARWRRPRFTARTALHRLVGELAFAAVFLLFLGAQ